MAELEQVTWWCSHDLDPKLADFPQVEYDLGIFDYKGNLKPTGQALADFKQGYADGTITPYPAGKETLPIEAPASGRISTRPDGQLFATWAQAIEDGTPLRLDVQHV